MQYSMILCNAVRYYAKQDIIQYYAIQYKTILCKTKRWIGKPNDTVQCSTAEIHNVSFTTVKPGSRNADGSQAARNIVSRKAHGRQRT